MPTTSLVNQIYTIGHSNHDMTTFLKLISDNSIQIVVDVRSAPYSKYVPQFNKREVEKAVTDEGYKYIFMGDSIGGKPSDSKFIDPNGKVNYERLADSRKFQEGLNRLNKGLQDNWIIVLMCAEEDPFKCHRHLLIANELELRRNVSICHIRSDGSKIRARKYLKEYNGQLRLF